MKLHDGNGADEAAGHDEDEMGQLPPWDLAASPVVPTPVDALLSADSPRLAGENLEHARMLAESGATFPPIIVQRSTMRVVDGMHRLHAARLRGQDEIDVQYYDGDDDDAFVIAVTTNVKHGLPLSSADRREAALRIVRTHPSWSDRAIASITGLEHKAVGAIRRCSAGDAGQPNGRVGRDGRTRPTDVAARRRVAGELLTRRPDASLREIAKAAGIAVSTARDVRERLRSGRDPVPARQRGVDQPRNHPETERPVRRHDNNVRTVDRVLALKNLKNDPSLRFSEAGRLILRWLDSGPATNHRWEHLVDALPPHCVEVVTQLARERAASWLSFTDRLERRDSGPVPPLPVPRSSRLVAVAKESRPS